jgi:hypothetical protein
MPLAVSMTNDKMIRSVYYSTVSILILPRNPSALKNIYETPNHIFGKDVEKTRPQISKDKNKKKFKQEYDQCIFNCTFIRISCERKLSLKINIPRISNF